mgnify:CR=1 FL=1|tara:strand:- start:7119 stop:8186 length:1068 start_codon:yes stop_codon:yes gene_type:complete
MKKLILFTFLISFNAFAQFGNFFKYSTIYFAGNVNSPLAEQPDFSIDRLTGEFVDLTEVNSYNYNLTIGLRKMARFDYENRANVFYDGTESNASSKAPVGMVKGFEYLVNHSMIRNRGEEFKTSQFWLRYLGNSFTSRLEYSDNQDIDLKHYGVDFRLRKKVKNFDFTAGVKHRTHPVYGVNPFLQDFDLQQDAWWMVAYDLGYTDEFWSESDYTNWNWYNADGEQIAMTDEEFMKYHFGDAIAEYNEDVLQDIGMQQELSAIFGVTYYTYQPKFWLHTWLDVMPLHKGLSEYSFSNIEHPVMAKGIPPQYDWDFGVILGTKINRNIGLFIEGSHQRYWCIENYSFKFGVNYLFL